MSIGRNKVDVLLNGMTLIALAVACGLVTRDRILPALRERKIVDPGDRVPAGMLLRNLSTGDTVDLGGLVPATFLVFLTTCPACESSTPAWRDALGRAPESRLITVAVGDHPDAVAWTARELPGRTTLQPLDVAGFLNALRIRVVPTAFSIGTEGRMLDRRAGILSPHDAWKLLTAPHDRGTPADP
jgi:hypothetical protein